MSSPSTRCTRSVSVFAATCSGCIGLSRSIELPLACMNVSVDAESAIDVMNLAGHGGAALWLDAFQPFQPQHGWRDWHLLPFEADGDLPDGIRIEGGRIALDLPADVPTTTFKKALHAELHRCRLDTVATSPAWLVARSDAGKPLLVLPRYTLTDQNDFRRGAGRVDDLFVLEPTTHCGLVATLAQRAMARAIGIAEEASVDGD